MAIPISTRLLPNTFFGVIFTVVGLAAGFASGCLLHLDRFRASFCVFYVFFLLAILCVRQLWYKGTYARTSRRLTFVSPRLLAVLLGVCLVAGLAAGAAVSFTSTMHPTRSVDLSRSHAGLLAQNPP